MLHSPQPLKLAQVLAAIPIFNIADLYEFLPFHYFHLIIHRYLRFCSYPVAEKNYLDTNNFRE